MNSFFFYCLSLFFHYCLSLNRLEEEELVFGEVAERERERKRDRHTLLFGMTDEREGFRGGALYPELWKLCAGPLVDLPSRGEKVFYFPQGHLEQLEVSTNELRHHKIPGINIASKILCRVEHVKLMVEKDTDEVYAEINLFPESAQCEPTPYHLYVPEPPRPPIHSFCKLLTASDTSVHGGFSIPRKHATDCMPSLDINQSPPTQELVAKDLHGREWKFKHIFRGQPQRHLLTTGFNTFVTYKKVVVDDAFVFLRCGNGELGVGVRHLAHQQTHMPSSPMISRQCMIVGALVTPQIAVTESTNFVINYNPRKSQFIVGFNKYIKAINNNFCIGTRCQMRVEEEGSKIRRITGTIIEVGDLSPHWTKSEWRSLKVLWDEHSTSWPERVSPWEIEQVVHVPLNLAQLLVTSKRLKTYNIASSGGVAKVQSSSSEDVVWPLRRKESNDNKYFSSKMCVEGIESSSPNLDLSLSLFAASQEGNKNVSMGPRPPSFPSPLQFGSSKGGFRFFNNISMVTQSKQESIVPMRSRTKVLMEGVDVGRDVDLAAVNSYDGLLVELEKLFLIEREVRPMNKWAVSFTYDDNDDNAWPEFCKMVKKICISSRCENKA